MDYLPQVKIPATYMRGGTSKGVFFRLQDLPERCQVPGEARDRLFMRVIGSPDPYSAHIDGMGGATSSTSKCVILSKSTQPEHDVDYLYGQVSIDKAFVDWSGNCGNLSTAAGAFAIHAGLVDPARGEKRDLVVSVGEDGPAAAVVEGHDDLERPLGQTPGVIGPHNEVGKLINQVHATFHWFTSDLFR